MMYIVSERYVSVEKNQNLPGCHLVGQHTKKHHMHYTRPPNIRRVRYTINKVSHVMHVISSSFDPYIHTVGQMKNK